MLRKESLINVQYALLMLLMKIISGQTTPNKCIPMYSSKAKTIKGGCMHIKKMIKSLIKPFAASCYKPEFVLNKIIWSRTDVKRDLVI